VQAGVRAEEAERDPALVEPWRRGALEAADIAGPGTEGGEAEGEARADGFGEGGGRRFGVAAPALSALAQVRRKGVGKGEVWRGEGEGHVPEGIAASLHTPFARIALLLARRTGVGASDIQSCCR
jgi:hypothetical protein